MASDREMLIRMDERTSTILSRLDGVSADMTQVRERLHAHGNRLQVLDAKIDSGDAAVAARISVAEGERKGVARAVTIMWTIAGSGVTALVMGMIALVLRAKGV